MLAKIDAIKRTKNPRAELVQAYKEDKEFNDRPNEDSGYESEKCDEPWKNLYKDEKYITDKELEIVL